MEGSPVALIEAAHVGCPAVATDVGGVPSVVVDERTGLLCPAGDAAALAAGVSRLLEDRDLRERKSAAARRHAAREFSVERMVGAHRELYTELLA